MIVLGLMSGTSMDGLDCCLANIEIDKDSNLEFEVIDFKTFAYDSKTIKIIYETIFLKKYTKEFIDKYLANLYSDIIKKFLKNRPVSLIAIHGQTISHKDRSYSIQACDPKIVRNNFNVPIVDNFRMADIKCGGNGAPLVPILDWYLYKQSKKNTITINIGGISNISFIPNNLDQKSVIGFDTGPGMCLVDRFVNITWNKKYDNNGEVAKKGKINNNLLNLLLEDPFIIKTPPKSASTESYNPKYINAILEKNNNINNYDILRTFVNFTPVSIKKNISLFIKNNDLFNSKIIVSGGGVKNMVLFEDLKNEFNNIEVKKFHINGLDINNKESFLICLLGYTKFKNIYNNIPSVTGAKKKTVCGDLYES